MWGNGVNKGWRPCGQQPKAWRMLYEVCGHPIDRLGPGSKYKTAPERLVLSTEFKQGQTMLKQGSASKY